MARPERHDVDYFPFIIKRGRTLNALESEYGNEGTGFFTNLMRLLCATPDHYYCFQKERDKRNFFSETLTANDKEKALTMLKIMIDTEKLDRELWENHNVIFCYDLLLSLKDAYKQRKNNIITIDEIRQKFLNINGNSSIEGVSIHGNTQEGVISIHGNPQTKLKKTKLKKTKVNISETEKPIALLDREPKNDMEHVNKKWLENYISIFNSQPINIKWNLSSPLIKKILKQVGIEKTLLALDAAMSDKFCLETGYLLQIIMSGNVISRLINKPKKNTQVKSAQTLKIATDNISDEKLNSFFKKGE